MSDIDQRKCLFCGEQSELTSTTNLRLKRKDQPTLVYKGQVSTFAIGKIAFQVLHVFEPDGGDKFDWRLATTDRPDSATIQLWPGSDRRVLRWPPPKYFDDQALDDFGNRFGFAPPMNA